MSPMQRAECSRCGPVRVFRRMMLAVVAATAAIVLSFGPMATGEARCKPGQAGAQASSLEPADLDTTIARLQNRYDCSRSMQANFDETLSSPGGLTRTRK